MIYIGKTMLPSCQQIKPGAIHTVTAHFPVNSDSCKRESFWQLLGAAIFPRKEEPPESSSGTSGFLSLQPP